MCLIVTGSSWAYAQGIPPTVLPGAADASRIRSPEPEQPAVAVKDDNADVQHLPAIPIPKNAGNVKFTLKQVVFDGATVFPARQLENLYKPYVGETVSLERIYMIAGALTERYRNAGYFLSLAYVPDQKIHDGIVTIRVVEGYVSTVEVEGPLATQRVVQGYIARLTAQRPVTSDAVESFLLRMNDLPGYAFKSLLSSADKGTEGMMKLTLSPTKKSGAGNVTFDNYGSRFLGPHELSGTYSTSLLPLQQTTVNGLASIPTDELKYGVIDHTIMLAPALTLDFNGGLTKAAPGYSLERFNIDSTSTVLGIGLNYQWLRQRQENLAVKLSLDGRNSDSDLGSSTLSRDKIRTLRANASGDFADRWRGFNSASVTLSQGIDGLGASSKGDLNLSRAEATPDFTKLEANITRLQALTEDWALLIAADGQLASGPLFSSEEFGYGGQAFGRAFDNSEIVGDHGISGSLELRYGGWKDMAPVSFQPYAFVDAGEIWNDDKAQVAHDEGSSAGVGLRFATEWHQNGNVGLAFPLDREISAPLYGTGKNGPRVVFQLSQEF